jgi:O-antigen ligase
MEQPRLAAALRWIGQTGFSVLFILVMCTPAWRSSLFNWWPFLETDIPGRGSLSIGVFNLLPLVIALAWFGREWLCWRNANGTLRATPRIQWGTRGIWLPFAGLSLLGLFSLAWLPAPETSIFAAMIVMAWLVYLYLINERPSLITAISVVLLVQGTITIAQFYLQHEIGLSALGEVVLDLDIEGTSVLWARGQNWLRGYGLTTHPNVLGAILSTSLLLILPQFSQWHRWPLYRQTVFLFIIFSGIAGLFLSFSRSSWLAFVAGLLAWLLIWLVQRWRQAETKRPTAKPPPRVVFIGLLLVLPTLWLFVAYHDLAFSRFVDLESPIEARSISERLGSAEIALQLIAAHPWRGVGLGRFVAVAQEIDPNSGRVHNVPLLIAAELGISGLLLWLWLMLDPFWQLWRPPAAHMAGINGNTLYPPAIQLAPWVGMIVLNLFDTTLWLGENWQTAFLFIVLVAHLVRPVNIER